MLSCTAAQSCTITCRRVQRNISQLLPQLLDPYIIDSCQMLAQTRNQAWYDTTKLVTEVHSPRLRNMKSRHRLSTRVNGSSVESAGFALGDNGGMTCTISNRIRTSHPLQAVPILTAGDHRPKFRTTDRIKAAHFYFAQHH